MVKSIPGLYFFPVIFILSPSTFALAQQTHHYTVVSGQPSALHADAGKDITSLPGESVTLGNDPAASGGTSPYTFLWNGGDGLSDPEHPNPSVTTSDEEVIYTLTVTDAAGCKAIDDLTIFTEIITSVAPNGEISFTVSPNPVKGWLTIRSGERRGGTLTVLDSRGTPLLEEMLEPVEHRLNLGNLSSGVYLLRLSIDRTTHTVKLLVP